MQNHILESVLLRQWRERRGLTLQETGDLLAVSPSMLSRMERGERRVRPLDRVRFARLLGARVGELFARQGRA